MSLNLFDEFWFRVRIAHARKVHGVQCRIIYPSDLIEAVLDEDGNVKTKLGRSSTNGDRNILLHARLEDDRPGKVVVGLNNLGDKTTDFEDGPLVDVCFKCVGIGQGNLRFDECHIYDEQANEMPSKWLDASVIVIGVNVVSAEIVPGA